MEEEIILDCGNLRNMQLIDRNFQFPPSTPTSDFDSFAKNFRLVAKHPFRISAKVPELPRNEETHSACLPVIGGHEPESESEQSDVRPSKRRPPAGRMKPQRGRSIISRIENLKAFFAVAMTREQKSILFLYRRHDVYLIAMRDSNERWWEFSSKGGKLFKDTKGLGFSESYSHMDLENDVSISRFQFEEAFFIFSNPDLHSIEKRKRASQVMIALTSESGRMTALSNKFGVTLSDESGQLNEILGGSTNLLINNWRKVSHHIIDNSGSSNLNNRMENVLNENDIELVKVLKEARMEKVVDAPNVYGLLLAKPTHSTS